MILLVLGTLTIAGFYVWQRHRRRLKQFDDLDEVGVASSLRLLLESGYDGATMVLRDAASNRFVQFRKYIGGPGQIGIESHFPLAPWSQQYYDSVVALLRKKGLAFDSLTGNVRPTTEVIHIDFGSNVDQAVSWAVDVFTIVFGCSQLRVSVRADGIDPHGSRVERVDHPRPIDYIFKRRWR